MQYLTTYLISFLISISICLIVIKQDADEIKDLKEKLVSKPPITKSDSFPPGYTVTPWVGRGLSNNGVPLKSIKIDFPETLLQKLKREQQQADDSNYKYFILLRNCTDKQTIRKREYWQNEADRRFEKEQDEELNQLPTLPCPSCPKNNICNEL